MFDGEEYEKQEQKELEEAHFGICKYSEQMHEFHQDVMALLETKKYEDLDADEAIIVFGRIYGAFVLSESVKQGEIEFVEDDSVEKSGDRAE